ncbi:MAG: hypothetical protein U1F87_15385 [Kiritimatiellia bacterium]
MLLIIFICDASGENIISDRVHETKPAVRGSALLPFQKCSLGDIYTHILTNEVGDVNTYNTLIDFSCDFRVDYGLSPATRDGLSKRLLKDILKARDSENLSEKEAASLFRRMELVCQPTVKLMLQEHTNITNRIQLINQDADSYKNVDWQSFYACAAGEEFEDCLKEIYSYNSYLQGSRSDDKINHETWTKISKARKRLISFLEKKPPFTCQSFSAPSKTMLRAVTETIFDHKSDWPLMSEYSSLAYSLCYSFPDLLTEKHIEALQLAIDAEGFMPLNKNKTGINNIVMPDAPLILAAIGGADIYHYLFGKFVTYSEVCVKTEIVKSNNTYSWLALFHDFAFPLLESALNTNFNSKVEPALEKALLISSDRYQETVYVYLYVIQTGSRPPPQVDDLLDRLPEENRAYVQWIIEKLIDLRK